jgi:cell division septum initiation protein DivIVA
LNSRPLSLVFVAAIGLALACAFSGVAAASARTGKQRVDPRPLWSAFPLDQGAPARPRATSHESQRRAHHSPSTATNALWPVVGGATILFLLAAAAVAVARGRRHARDARTPAAGAQNPATERVPQIEGGSGMSGPARRRWFAGGNPDGEGTAVDDEAAGSSDASARISRYTSDEQDSTVASQASPSETEAGVERSAGEEIDTILRTAREAAAKIVQTATTESEQARADARQAAEREREEAAAVRAEAEAYAQRTRNEADAAAEQVRADAEREADSMLEAARARLESADGEVAAKIERAEETARQRVEILETQARLHEERIAQLLKVFQGMSAQLEQLLGRRSAEAPTEPEEQLGEALHPDRASERVA